jgi:hypothetical protein
MVCLLSSFVVLGGGVSGRRIRRKQPLLTLCFARPSDIALLWALPLIDSHPSNSSVSYKGDRGLAGCVDNRFLAVLSHILGLFRTEGFVTSQFWNVMYYTESCGLEMCFSDTDALAFSLLRVLCAMSASPLCRASSVDSFIDFQILII